MYFLGGRDRGVRTWEKRGGEVYRRAGSRISKVVGSVRNRELMQHCTIFCNQKSSKKQEPPNKRHGMVLKGTGSTVLPPPSPPPTS